MDGEDIKKLKKLKIILEQRKVKLRPTKPFQLFSNKKESPPPPLLPPRAKRQARKYLFVYNQKDRIPPTTQRLSVFAKKKRVLHFVQPPIN